MFTAIELEYLEDLVEQNINNGVYKYYVAHTISSITQGTNIDYDFIVYFSIEPIKCDGYIFSITGDYLVLTVDSTNASYSHHIERVLYEYGKNTKVYVDEYEAIYSNAANSFFANCLSYNNTTVTNILIAVLLLVTILKWCFPNTLGGD